MAVQGRKEVFREREPVLSHALSPQKLRDWAGFPHTWADSSLPPDFHGLTPS